MDCSRVLLKDLEPRSCCKVVSRVEQSGGDLHGLLLEKTSVFEKLPRRPFL